MMHAHDLIFRLFFIFLIIRGSHCFIVKDDFTYCDDSRIIDFSSSCISSKPTCIDQVEYLKSFLNFRDYYIRPSGTTTSGHHEFIITKNQKHKLNLNKTTKYILAGGGAHVRCVAHVTPRYMTPPIFSKGVRGLTNKNKNKTNN